MTDMLEGKDYPQKNDRMIVRLEQAVAALLGQVLRRGFHGTAGVEIAIQDGIIQHVRSKTDRLDR
jgi:hypothetical protein